LLLSCAIDVRCLDTPDRKDAFGESKLISLLYRLTLQQQELNGAAIVALIPLAGKPRAEAVAKEFECLFAVQIISGPSNTTISGLSLALSSGFSVP
jgi:hypothetical protein